MKHNPVLLDETVTNIIGDINGLYIDCTLGGGGHTRELLSRLGKNARVIALDRDLEVLEKTRAQFNDHRINFFHVDFRFLKRALTLDQIGAIDGIMIDLGVSSFQLDDADRGFSYHADSELDMRMDTQQNLNAWFIVNNYSEEELTDIIFKYGEERFARKIARAIVKARSGQAINTTLELVDVIKSAIPAKFTRDKHPARKTFQAIRIAVNDELTALEQVLPQAIEVLKPGGRLAVITFHSLEDRIVKKYFNDQSKNCICPPQMLVCSCGGNKAAIKIINRKPIIPAEAEIAINSRARSAKLRVVEKI
jgi:16S rRNA (cytosine1402-N4)-methyltransferase